MPKPSIERERGSEVLRYILNGIVATIVHFAILSFGIEVLEIPSAGFANFIAACIGITVSFLGNRYYVFRAHGETMLRQALHFAGLYASIACLHSAVLFLWTDWLGSDYRIGFVLATGLQVSLSYIGNKLLVFSK